MTISLSQESRNLIASFSKSTTEMTTTSNNNNNNNTQSQSSKIPSQTNINTLNGLSSASDDSSYYPLFCNDISVDLSDPLTVKPLMERVFPAWASATLIIETGML